MRNAPLATAGASVLLAAPQQLAFAGSAAELCPALNQARPLLSPTRMLLLLLWLRRRVRLLHCCCGKKTLSSATSTTMHL